MSPNPKSCSTILMNFDDESSVPSSPGGLIVVTPESGRMLVESDNNSSTQAKEISIITIVWLKILTWFSRGNKVKKRFRYNSKSHSGSGKVNDLHMCEIEDQETELIGKESLRTSNPPPLPDPKDFHSYLNYGSEDQMEITGYEISLVKTGITWFFIIITLGLLRLVFHWYPELMLYSTHRATKLKNAEKVLIMEHYQQKYKRYYVKNVILLRSNDSEQFSAKISFNDPSITMDQSNNIFQKSKLIIPNSNGIFQETHSSIRYFTCKKLRYIWYDSSEQFLKLSGIDRASTAFLHESNGLSPEDEESRRLIYGPNQIIVEVQGITKLLFLEVLNPFYVFQIFSVTLWLSDNYYYYAAAIILMSIFGIGSTILQTRDNQKKLKTTIQTSDVVTVHRGNSIFESVPTELLVPGDVIVIPPHGCTMHCDAALLAGNCIVNESMLTGESVPVTKIPLANRSDLNYDLKEHARNTLFCGTQVIQTRYYGNERVLAIVLRTGFLTSKGDLVRSILYPPPVDYKFERDSYKFVAVLGAIASVGFIFSVYLKITTGETVRNIIIDSLDLITIVVPPALPAAMTVGRFYAQRRLQQRGIYCISPRAINVSGSINCVCFDKTGTLTEEGLDLWGTVPISRNDEEFPPTFADPIRSQAHLSYCSPFTVGMATCHSLTRIDGNLVGDPLDLKMFDWVDWSFEEPSVADTEKFDMMVPTIVRPKKEVNHNNLESIVGAKQILENASGNLEIGIVRQFPFSSSLQRMSVITRKLGDSEYELYAKGAPEMIKMLCRKESVPTNFSSTLQSYTQEGYRVIALGYKRLPKLNYKKVQRIEREEIEHELEFLGLIVMENRLKPETTDVMEGLKKANIRTIMVTGDNILTAISVARECGMIESDDKVIVLNNPESDARIPRLEYTFASVKSQNTKPNLDDCSSSIDIETGDNCSKKRIPYHFAITGSVFSIIKQHYPELLPKLLVRGTVFARMSPEQKQHLVELLQGLGYFVGMCGDGANDCGALKASHAGISLSDTESSVASPFTSKEPNITCVPHLIREGRSALVTSFGIFKYMAIYSLTQFISVLILYTLSINLTDLEFLYIDLFLISVFAFFFGNAEPHPGPLVKEPPSASLISLSPIVSILSHLVVIAGVQIGVLFYTMGLPWYEPPVYEPGEKDNYKSHANYSIFIASSFQYIIMAIVFSKGKPYRRSIFSNPRLLLSLILMTAITVYIALQPFDHLSEALELLVPENIEYKCTLLIIALAQFLVCLLIEFVLIDKICSKIEIRMANSPKNSKKEYLKIEYELRRLKGDWPQISNSNSVDDIQSVAICNEKEAKSQS